jgi:hypothetical protein
MRPYALTAFLCCAVAAAAQQDAPKTPPPGEQPLPVEAAKADTSAAKPLPEESWSECDEYISESPCKVTINLGSEPVVMNKRASYMPHAHWDVQVKPFEHLRKTQPLGKAAVLLVRSSPFLSCTVSAVPANPARDLSTNIGSLLTSVAGIGAPPLTAQAITKATSANPDVEKLFQRLKDLSDRAQHFRTAFQAAYKDLGDAQKKDWKYSFQNDKEATGAIDDLRSQAEAFLGMFDVLPAIATAVAALSRDIAAYEATNPDSPGRATLDRQLQDLKDQLEGLKAYTAAYADKQKQVRQLVEFLVLPRSGLTVQALPMGYFAQKTVTETVACKDVISNNPAFDNIVFIAYYEGLPHFDISVGALASLLGGRQTSTVTAPFTPAQAAACQGMTGCGPSTTLTYKVRSAYQFIPTVLAEWRWANFHCPWAHNGTPWHPFGYVCSVGVAGGPAINPNNGGPAAEVFGGLSVGIQRFSILIGAHHGRYQEYGGGFYAGETFPPGTSVTPLTVYRWATHPAFGITYRIPIR